ncbi:PP2C family protein-serine/threonine phosphatase [Salinispora cortesiana]|uniref:PP2C family protein-serine/threonine phosphatase n=1 Tax=Salinispora cortesiana TaxID=1305843 RepID=UPI000470CDE7|nr:protein phosphatase 2C domain-containing protein [Salinispora cortesiana]
MSLRIDVAGSCHLGLGRRRNEDAIHVGRCLFAVADGLGNHGAGDVASATVIEAVRRYDREVEPGALPVVLGEAVQAANRAVRHRVAAEPGLAGMGTTLVALLSAGSAAALANIGDSRAYLLPATGPQRGRTIQITEDHLYRHLVAGAGEVPNLSDKLTRFLDGHPDGRSPDIIVLPLTCGDRILLCSDGLSSFVSPEHLHATLATAATAQQAVDRLVASALTEGGQDVSAIVLHVRDDS